jgi:hypothetical protein
MMSTPPRTHHNAEGELLLDEFDWLLIVPAGLVVASAGVTAELAASVGDGAAVGEDAALLVNMNVPDSESPSGATVFHATVMAPTGTTSSFTVAAQ